MNIKIDTLGGGLKEWIPEHVKNKLLEVHHRYQKVSNFQVIFKNEPEAIKTCEIIVGDFGDSLFISKSSNTFEMAMRKAVDELFEKMEEWVRLKNEPPEESVSTVNV